MKKLCIAIFFIILTPIVFLFAGCEQKIQYKLNFIVDGEVYAVVDTTGEESISMPSDPKKDGYEFIGWFLDKDIWQKEVKANSFLKEKIDKNINVFANFRYIGDEIFAQSISISKSQLNLELNEQQTLVANILPGNVTNKDITWGSSNVNVVTVNNGVVKAVNYGTATITARTSNNLTASCQVNVINKSQNVQIEVYIDGEVVETLVTNAVNDYKIVAPQKPQDITTNPNAEKYFYGWFVDSNYQTPLTEDRIFLSNGKIYGKWIDVYANNFDYSVSKGKATINFFTNIQRSTVLVIPCYLNSFPVERIGAGVFINQTTLRNVIICDGIEYIDASAFYGCNSMQSIQLPNTLKEIGVSAFENCELLDNIDLPNALTKIGVNAFKNCGLLNNVNFNNDNWWLTNDENYVFDSFVSTTNTYEVAKNLTESFTNKIWVNYALYNINYNLYNGALPDNVPLYFCEYTNVNLVGPQKNGYDFVGYYLNNDFSGNQITNISKGTKSDINVYANYSLITYLITYQLNDGVNNPNNPITYNIEMDNILLLDAIKDYYDFVDWTLDDEIITEIDTSLCKNIELKASYTPTIYTITYVLNGGTNNISNPLFYTIETSNITLTPAVFKNESVSRWYLEETFENRIKDIPLGSHGNLTLYARAGYDGYDTVTINDNNVVTGANKSFLNEFSITEIIVPDSVQYINQGAFSGCGNLTHITLPFVGGSRKGENDDYQYPFGYVFGTSSYSGSKQVCQYYRTSVTSTTSTYYYIPSSLKSATITGEYINYGAFYNCGFIENITISNRVTSIGSNAFYGCSSLTSITIPSSVTSIGYSAFSGCSSLTSVTIPSSVTSIGVSAFYGCSSLTSVAIPSGVTSIGNYAFYNCSSLTSVAIPSGVTSIERYTFENCSSLTSIIVDENNMVYDSRNNCNAIVETSTNTLIVGCKNTRIPDSVTSIRNYTFYNCTGLTSVTVPNSVTSIGDYAFYGCTCLTSVTIPSSVTSIGSSAFSGCSSLRFLTIGKIIEGNNSLSSIISVYSKLKNITILDGVTSIGGAAFYNCTGLTSITIPSSVTSIGVSAFSDCSSLTSITIPDSVKSIGNTAFSGCSSLTSITIPNSVTSIGVSAFSGCSSLTSITIPDSVTSIENYTFNNCSSLTSVTIPSSVTSIGGYTFQYCSSLTNITIPDSVTSIRNYTFYNCTGLTSVTVPNSVTSIGNYAFYGCTNLKSITIPDSVKSIGGCAFYNCSSLTSITIPDSVKSIGGDAFNNCSSLTSVTIPSSVTSIENYTFNNCSSLTSVTIPSSVTSIGWNAFYGCRNLTNITIPDSVKSIGGFAFYGCRNLTNITIPSSVTSIENFTFYNCSSLTSVTIPSSVKSIRNNAFYGCRRLTSVVFENPDRWRVETPKETTNLSSQDLSNRTIAATYLTQTYCNSDWLRS